MSVAYSFIVFPENWNVKYTHSYLSIILEDITLTSIHFLETDPNLHHNHHMTNPNLNITLN